MCIPFLLTLLASKIALKQKSRQVEVLKAFKSLPSGWFIVENDSCNIVPCISNKENGPWRFHF